jgi:carbonic anhydrase/acetyltransferase-like protein (isoleucine patch superfamily)
MADSSFGTPEIHPESYVHNKSSVIGRVIIEAGVIVAPSASIRADEGNPFKICKGTNIQDGVIMHGLEGKYVEAEGKEFSIWIGSHCSITHNALIHGPTKIGKKTFIGFKSIINNSIIGRNCHIGDGAIVKGVIIADGRYVDDGQVVNSQRIADSLLIASAEKQEFNKVVVDVNKKKLLGRYKQQGVIISE